MQPARSSEPKSQSHAHTAALRLPPSPAPCSPFALFDTEPRKARASQTISKEREHCPPSSHPFLLSLPPSPARLPQPPQASSAPAGREATRDDMGCGNNGWGTACVAPPPVAVATVTSVAVAGGDECCGTGKTGAGAGDAAGASADAAGWGASTGTGVDTDAGATVVGESVALAMVGAAGETAGGTAATGAGWLTGVAVEAAEVACAEAARPIDAKAAAAAANEDASAGGRPASAGTTGAVPAAAAAVGGGGGCGGIDAGAEGAGDGTVDRGEVPEAAACGPGGPTDEEEPALGGVDTVGGVGTGWAGTSGVAGSPTGAGKARTAKSGCWEVAGDVADGVTAVAEVLTAAIDGKDAGGIAASAACTGDNGCVSATGVEETTAVGVAVETVAAAAVVLVMVWAAVGEPAAATAAAAAAAATGRRAVRTAGSEIPKRAARAIAELGIAAPPAGEPGATGAPTPPG